MSEITIQMSGFKSFVEPTTVKLPLKPGVYLVRGNNGAGKSSLFDAIHWALYGTTARGAKASNIVSWTKRKASVSVKIAGHSITRTQSPNAILLDNRACVQDDLERALGLNQAAFSQAVLFGQFTPLFLDLSPADKLSRLSEILELDLWEKCGDKARALVSESDRVLLDMGNSLHRNIGRKEVLLATIREATENAKTWDKQQTKRIDELKDSLRCVKTRLEEADALLESASFMNQECPHKLTQLMEDIKKAEDDLRSLLKEQSRVQSELKTHKAALAKLDRLGPTCGECGQKIPTRYKEEQHHAINKNVGLSEVELGLLTGKLNNTSDSLSKLRSKYDANQRNSAKADATRTSAQRTIDACMADAETIVAEIAKVRASTNVWSEQSQTTTAQLAEVEALITADTEKSTAEKEKSDLARFWVDGFKALRLWLVDKCLAELEIEVNNSLLQLGLPGWAVSFAVERETKTKTISRGFNVLVSAPGSKEGVPWILWSGGETQRLKLAAAIGFGNLLRSKSRNAAIADLPEIWDEPTAHLSEQGVVDLLDLLTSRAQSEQRAIYIIDHRALDYGGFAGVYTVSKDGGSSAIVSD